LAHRPLSDGLPEAPYLAARVAFTDVADGLGITRPALYKLWPSQYEFWIDLSRYIAYEVDYSQPDHAMPWNARYVDAPPPPPQTRLTDHEIDRVVATQANTVQDIVLADTWVLIRAASLGYPDVDDLGRIRQQVETRRLDLLDADIASSLPVLGRSAQAHIRRDLVASIWSIADGLSVLNRFIPDCARRVDVDFGHGTQSWTMLALAVRSLYFGFSHPASPGSSTHPSAPIVIADIEAPAQPWSDLQLAALEVAAKLFVDSITDSTSIGDGPNVLRHVTVARLATLAGVSRRTIYNVWPTRAEMMSGLLDDLLEQGRAAQRAVFDATTGRGLGEVTNALVGPPGVAVPVEPVSAFLIELGDDLHRATIATSYRQRIADFVERLDAHLSSTHRRPRPGIELHDLGLLWLCLAEGGRRLRRVSPEKTVMFDVAAETVVHELTVDDVTAPDR